MASPKAAEEQPQFTTALTKYPSGSLRELFSLSLPLIFVLLSGCLMSFCDRLFLAHYSLESFQGCLNAFYVSTLFQVPCMRVTSMAQVFVGLHKGANSPLLIGKCVWQMIWFSVLSMAITWPLGNLAGPFFLGGTSVEAPAMIYFQCMMVVNFLFPLGAALSSFYIGEGKTRILFLVTLCTHLLNIFLAYVLIFGMQGIFPPLGVFGAGLATAIAQGFFCIVLLLFFLQREYRTIYGSHRWKPEKKAFWNYVKVGLPRAIARLMALFVWAATARILSLKGGDYLMVLSVGSTLFLFFAFIHEGMGQGIMTVASRLIGAKDYFSIRKLKRSSFLFLTTTMLLLSFPFLFYPEILLSFFNISSPATFAILQRACYGLWFSLLCNGFNMIGFSFISASCDTIFHMVANCLVWVTCYLPVYLAFEMASFPPEHFWILIGLDGLLIGSVLHWRAHKNLKGAEAPLYTK